MVSKQTRHEALRNRIVDCAETSIAESGLSAVSARAIAKDAECAVGAIYNVFDDLQAIIQSVNLRTFERMRLYVGEKLLDAKSPDPKENLRTAARAYLNFALENQRLWMTVFEIEMVPQDQFPKAYLEKSAVLFAMIEALIAQIYPDESEDEIRCLTRTIFSAVHGIVYLGVERRLLSVAQEDLEGMVDWLVRQILK